MSNLEKFTDVVSVAFEPYFGTPLIFNENKPAVPLWTNYLFINGALHYGHLEMFRSEKIKLFMQIFMPTLSLMHLIWGLMLYG